MAGAKLQFEKVAPEGEPGASKAIRWLNVLVVDDDPLNREMLGAFLRHKSAHVAEAEDGLEARRQIEIGSYDLVISDIDMPGLDGFDLLKWIKRHHETIEVIIVSGRADRDDVLRAMRLGASDYLSKPYRSEQLFAAVDRCRDKFQRAVPANQVLSFIRQSMHDVRHGLADLAGLVKKQESEAAAENQIPLRFNKVINTKIAGLISTTEDFYAEALMLAQSGQASSDVLFLKRDVIDKVLHSLAWELEDKRLTVQRIEKTDADAVQIKANGLMIRSALRNLMDNAIKNAPEQGQITFRIDNGGKYYLLSVENMIVPVEKSEIAPTKKSEPQGGARIPADCVDAPCLQGLGLGLEMGKYFAGLCGGNVWQEEHENKRKYVLALPVPQPVDAVEVI